MKKFSAVSDEWTAAVFGAEKFEIEVLVVADGDLTFIPGDQFGLTRFCEVLEGSSLPGEEIKVTKAHRKCAANETGADIKAFRFDTVDINRYDQIWLFGYEGEKDPKLQLTKLELQAITKFMNKGGGVFATGDHEALGCAMCGEVPRVRRMRRWHFEVLPKGELPAPSRNGSTRIDTLREGITVGFEEDDQADAIAQEIRPKFFANDSKGVAQAHELLQTSTFAITILPDHMHEGECVSPDEIKDRAANDKEVAAEFPLSDTGEQIWPEVVAIATSAGGTFVPKDGIRPVDPRSYIVISAYNGHQVQQTDSDGTVRRLGRVVVDTSFHHFVNVNLRGFIVNGVPKPEFEIFSRYYRNILRYLQSPKNQHSYFLHLLRALRFRPPLLEELQDLSPDNWEHVIYAGAVVNKVISKDFSPAHARRCALALLPDIQPDLHKELEDLIDLWKPRNEAEDKFFFLNSESIVIAVLGQEILTLASRLPKSHFEVNEVASGPGFQKSVREDLLHRVIKLQEHIGSLGKELERFSKIS